MAVKQFAYIVDLAATEAFALSDAEADASEIVREAQLAVAGEYVSGRYGRFPITEADIDLMVDNFSAHRHPVAPTELSVDYDHKEGEAAGWIKGLQKRVRQVGTRRVVELWGHVAWLKDAAEKIRSKKYRFFSPMFHREFVSPTGQKLGATLIGGALTNRPFLQGMAAISCSLGDGDAAVPAPHQTQRSSHMRLFTTKDKDGNEIQIDLDAIKDAPEIKALSAAQAATPPTTDAAAITAAVTAALAPVTAELTGLKSTVTQLSADVAGSKQNQTKAEAERLIDAAVREGKVAPAAKETLLKLSALEGGMDILRADLAARQPFIKLNTQHGHGSEGDEPTALVGDVTVTTENAEDEYEKSLNAFRAKPENLKLSYDAAMAKHDQQHPELARMFQLSFRRA